MSLRASFVIFSGFVCLAGAILHQTLEDNSSETDYQIHAEEKPLWDAAQSFLDAYAKRDAKAIGQMFTEDAEFYDEFGERTAGRDAIVTLFQRVFETNPEAILEAIDIERIRYINDQVVMEEGWISARDTLEGPLHFNRYVALHTLGEDGQWRINTLKDYPREAQGKSEQLDQLEWLIGDWVNEDGDTIVETSCRWSKDGNYLLRKYEVLTSAGQEMSGVQRIGWDPQRRQIRSWNFDSNGGFRESNWFRQDSNWVVTAQGTTSEGESLHATTVYQIADPERIVWTISSLVIGGEVMPSGQSVILTRAAPQPAETSN